MIFFSWKFIRDKGLNMSVSILMAFWAVSFLFVITPGMDWAYAISAGINGKMVLPAVGGMLIGHLIATIIIAAGVGVLIADIPFAMMLLTLVGACYLLWLGFGLVRHPVTPVKELTDTPHNSVHWMIKGIGISGLNPKVFLLFLALLPQFFDPKSLWPMSVQMLILGTIHIMSCGIIYLFVGYGSQVVLKTKPDAAKVVSQLSGIAMMCIAILLLVEPLIQHH
jgi:threonine/homoserine/homoserine lactone efflux protein